MTGESLLRLYVYGLALAFAAWTVLMGWVLTRSARRLLRRERALAAPVTEVEVQVEVADRHRVPA
jgi:threonine/homoserine/homoserine lactone efflux protein